MRLRPLALFIAFAAIILGGCTGGTKPTPTLGLSGKHSLVAGTTESLSALTTNGTDAGYSWLSSNTAVATVDTAGLITAVATGEAVITATGKNTGAVASWPVVVIAAPNPQIEITGYFSIVIGTPAKLTATTQGGTDSGYTWASSATGVATVAADGTVTGVSPGNVGITATGKDTGKSGTYNVVVAASVPHLADWQASAHADATAPAFNNWNAAGSIPGACARCHSTPGFAHYLGDDGSTPHDTSTAQPIGTVISCQACHNQTAASLTTVTFPSGVTLTGLGPEAKCMTCHQGRESTDSVDLTISTAAAANDDTVSSKLGFKNIHYFAAGATLNAGRVRGGYQYAGQTYDWRFRHVPGRDTCVGCHNEHTLKIEPTTCAKCHTTETGAPVATLADLRRIRMQSSLAVDYNGDGNTTQGIAFEIDGLRATLLTQIQSYVVSHGLPKICYSPAAYPYFFTDAAGDGVCGATVAVGTNAYATWTNRLLRAAYNYQVSLKDPGAFAHNAKYIIELLFDSINDINPTLPVAQQIDVSKLTRNDIGHFNGAGVPARHWDPTGASTGGVDASCSKCHSGSVGFKFYVNYGVGTGGLEPDNGLDCVTCHTSFEAPATPSNANPGFPTAANPNLVPVASALFPSNVTLKPDADTVTGGTSVHAGSFICITCHMGRESKATLDAQIAGGKFGFRNLHYLAAGATLFGHEAQVGYEYTGQTYAGRVAHVGGNDCNTCHNANSTKHTFRADDNVAFCAGCHQGITHVTDPIRIVHVQDYAGDGNTTESLQAVVKSMAARLLVALQANAAAGSSICYDGSAYPYFFKHATATGPCAAGENVYSNAYAAWTATLTKAAFNYQFSQKEPGAFAHNFTYMDQLLYDSIADLGGNTSNLIRATATQ